MSMIWHTRDHRGNLHAVDIRVMHTPHLLHVLRWLETHQTGTARIQQIEEVKNELRHRGKLPLGR